jgi:hypothetical protein
VILNVLAGRSSSDGAPREADHLEGSAFRRPHVAVEYVPAHGTNGSAGTERWSR